MATRIRAAALAYLRELSPVCLYGTALAVVAAAYVSAVRATQAYQLHSAYPIGVWAVILGASIIAAVAARKGPTDGR